MTAFPQILARLLGTDPGRPLITYYDDATGERTELSVATWANWVAKTGSLLADELELEPADRLLVDLPAHWLGTVVLGAAWSTGLEVVWEGDHDAVVTGPAGLERWAPYAADVPVVATALTPMAGRFEGGVPDGVHDLGVEVWSQPDSFVPVQPPTDDDLAVAGTTQGALWVAASSGELLAEGGRLLSEANPASPTGLASLTEPLTRRGSLVLARNADERRLEQIAATERVTARCGLG
jgi:uncharacterized protein (TIGR03089 family)